MTEEVAAAPPMGTSAWDMDYELPRHLEDAITRMRHCEAMESVLWPEFVKAFCAVKELEYATYSRVISSWEREHLLLLV
jgi:glutamine synthetase